MYKKAGNFFIIMSALLLMSSGTLIYLTAKDNKEAGEESAQIVNVWDYYTTQAKTEMDLSDMVEPSFDEPAEDISCVIGNASYIGILRIPRLELELPVNAEWSLEAAKTSPCRYTGSTSGSDLVIAAHNFNTQFGGLKTLIPGDTVSFTDVNGCVHSYEVTGTETLDGTDVDVMQEGDWDLTLFTCTIGGKSRVTVRCKGVSDEN